MTRISGAPHAQERIGYVRRGERIIKVAFVDCARRAVGGGHVRLLERRYTMNWQDTGAKLAPEDQAEAQIFVDHMRPPLLARLSLRRRTGKDGELRAHSEYYLSSGNLDAMRSHMPPVPISAGARSAEARSAEANLAERLAPLERAAFGAQFRQEMTTATLPQSLRLDVTDILDELDRAARAIESPRQADPDALDRLRRALDRLERIEGSVEAEEMAGALWARADGLESALLDRLASGGATGRAHDQGREDSAFEAEVWIEAVRCLKRSHAHNRPLSQACGQILRVLSRHHAALPEAPRAPPPNARAQTSSARRAMRAALAVRWSSRRKRGGLLPIPAPIPEREMLDLFVRHVLACAGFEDDNLPSLDFFYRQGLSAAINRRPAPPIERRWKLEPGDAAHAFQSLLRPADPAICSLARMQYDHVPNLAYTQLAGEGGEILWRGHRLAALDAYDLTPANLSQLGDAQLEFMLKALLGDPEKSGSEAQDLVRAFRASPVQRNRIAIRARRAAAEVLGRHMAAQMLLAHPHKRAQAQDGGVIDLPLAALSLIAPGSAREQAIFDHHRHAFETLNGDGGPVLLPLPGPGGREARVQARVRFFAFTIARAGDAQWSMCADPGSAPMAELVGAYDALCIGGRVRAAMNALHEEIRRLAPDHGSTAAGRRVEPENRFLRLVRRNCQLHHLGQQARLAWREPQEAAGNPYALPARVAALSLALGDEVAAACLNGRDRCGPFDSAIKHLHARMEAYGAPPPLTLSAGERAAHARVAHAARSQPFERREAGAQ